LKVYIKSILIYPQPFQLKLFYSQTTRGI